MSGRVDSEVDRAVVQGVGQGRARRLVVVLALIVAAVPMLPNSAGAEVAPPLANEPPFTGSIISFPARDFISAEGWGAYPFVDVEVLRANPQSPGTWVQIGIASDVAPQDGIVEVNHPGGACWTNVTPDIAAGDVVRLTAKDANRTPVIIDQTTTANVTVTQASYQVDASTVEFRGVALQAGGLPIDADLLEARLIGSSKDRFELNGRRDLRAPRDGSFAIDATGNWVATITGLSTADVSRALAAENRVVWLGSNPAAGTEATIFEVGPTVVPGPQSPCAAPLQAAIAAPDRSSIEFPATDVGTISPPEPIRIGNIGSGAFADLLVSSITVTGADATQFAISQDLCTGVPVAVAGHCDLQVSFAPLSSGLKSAVVQIQSNAGNTLVPVTATGFAANGGEQIAFGFPTPAFLGFGTRAAGNTSPSQSVTVKNIGNVALQIGSLDLTGANPGDFAIVSSSCISQSVNPGAACAIEVDFTPGDEGPRSASLVVSSNGNPVTVPLQGEGLITTGLVDPPPAPIVLGVFTARDFVSVEGFDAGEPLTLQIIRSGVVVGVAHDVPAGDDGIAEVNHPGGGCWEGITPNIRAGDILRVTRNDGRAYQTSTADVKVLQRATETIAGSGIVVMKGYARDLASGGPLPLSQIEARIIGASADPFTINGRRSIRSGAGSEGALEYDPISAANPDGIMWTATWDLSTSTDVAHDVALAEAEENRILWLGRDPVALFETTFWEDGADVVDGPSAPCTAPGEAASAGIAISPSLQVYPALTTSEQAERTFTVWNIGTAPLSISSVTFGGANPGDFSAMGGVAGPLAPGESDTFRVRFNPTALGVRTATVRVNDNAVGSPHTAMVTGTGVAVSQPAALATPGALQFADTPVGIDSVAQTVTISNEGGAPLTFDPVPTIAGPNPADFRIDDTVAGACDLTSSLDLLETCTVTVVFTPTDINGRTASLVIGSNDPVGPLQVGLVGISTTQPDGTFDPPRSPRSIDVFPVRDYVAGAGFPDDEFVRVDVYRGNVLIARSEPIVPRDLNPLDAVFDGFIEVNHVGGVCWDQQTPDILPGDTVRAVRLTGTGSVIGGDQTHVANVNVSMPATEVSPGVVVVTGIAIDPTTAQPITNGAFEPRLTSTTGLFAVNGRRDLRGGLDGIVTMNGSQWTATFSNLSVADVAKAVSGDTKVIWLGRDPLALTELTHWEWAEQPGPDPSCAAAAPASVPDPTLTPSGLDMGYAGLAGASPPVPAIFSNTGSTPVMPNVAAIVGPHAADFSVSSTTCTSALAPGGNCTVDVLFAPSNLGTRVASLPITHDGANGISYLPLTGVGVGTPTIATISSPVGVGSVAHITGANLISTTGISIGGGQATPMVISDAAIDFVVPTTVTPALSVPVTVTTAGGAVTTNIRVDPAPPTITTVTPSSATVGTTVVVTGANFTGATVTFNGVAATVVSIGATTITTSVPAGATTGLLRVETIAGAATANFTVIPAPTITSFSPTTARRGASITINGTNFVSGATAVRFTGTSGALGAAVTATVVSATQVRVTVPSYAVQGPVSLSTNGGTTSRVFSVELAPTVSSFGPTSGVVGQTVTITGNNFLTTSKVTFNGKNATFVIVSATTITAVIPSAAATGGIQVVNRWGSTTTSAFTVIRPPTVTSFTPTTVTVAARTVTVTGTNLGSTNAVRLSRGSTTVTISGFTILSSTQVRFIVPSAIATGLYTLRVTNPAGTAAAAAAMNVTG